MSIHYLPPLRSLSLEAAKLDVFYAECDLQAARATGKAADDMEFYRAMRERYLLAKENLRAVPKPLWRIRK